LGSNPLITVYNKLIAIKTFDRIMDKIKLVVIDNHTLGYLIPNSTMAGILRTSILKGSTWDPNSNVETKGRQVRLASEKDFDEFMVSFEGYKKKPEEYQFV
jgi:hypothetical protein